MEEYRKIAGEKNGKMKMALLTKQMDKAGQKGKSSNKAKDKPIKNCSVCSKSGHTEEECWTKHPELRPKKDHPSGESSKKSSARIAMSAKASKAALTNNQDTKINPEY